MNKNNLMNDKGFTLVEMMAAVVIAGIIMGAIGTFLVVHMKSYEATQKLVTLQYDAQLSLNQMAEIAMESKGIEEIRVFGSYTDNKINEIGMIEPRILAIQGDDEPDGSSPHTYLYFFYPGDPYNLYFEDTIDYANTLDTILDTPDTDIGTVGEIVARNVRLYCVPGKGNLTGAVSSGESFAQSDSVEFILRIATDDAPFIAARGTLDSTASNLYEFKTLVKYRNKD